jgi:hypothetical protein
MAPETHVRRAGSFLLDGEEHAHPVLVEELIGDSFNELLVLLSFWSLMACTSVDAH